MPPEYGVISRMLVRMLTQPPRSDDSPGVPSGSYSAHDSYECTVPGGTRSAHLRREDHRAPVVVRPDQITAPDAAGSGILGIDAHVPVIVPVDAASGGP